MKLLLLTLTALLIAGCSIQTPAMSEYTVKFPASQHSSASSKYNKTLQVTHPKTLPSLNTKEFQYQRPSGEINGYLYSRWSDTPAYMVEHSLSLALSEAHLFSSVLPSTSAAQADYLLESTLLAFHQRLYQKPDNDVTVDIMCHLIDRNSKKVIASKRFSIVKTSKSYDAKGALEAFNEALEELNRHNSEWISTSMKGATH